MKRFSSSLALLGVTIALCSWLQLDAAPVDDKADDKSPKRNPKAVRAFMRGKLDASEQILEGLVTEDFELIQKGSDRLRVMSMRAEWNVLRGPVYADQSASFRRSAELIGKMAKEKNIDGATLSYLHLTMQCVNCHKVTRSADVVQATPHADVQQAKLGLTGRLRRTQITPVSE